MNKQNDWDDPVLSDGDFPQEKGTQLHRGCISSFPTINFANEKA